MLNNSDRYHLSKWYLDCTESTEIWNDMSGRLYKESPKLEELMVNAMKAVNRLNSEINRLKKG